LWVALVFAFLVHLVMHLNLWYTCCDPLVIFGQLWWTCLDDVRIYCNICAIYCDGCDICDGCDKYVIYVWMDVIYIYDIFCLSWWNVKNE
jgi:hypothetical protein